MKKMLLALLLVCSLLFSISAQAENTLTEKNQLMFDAVRWNLNLPKESQILHAEEYLFKMMADLTLHALLMEVSLSEVLENMYGTGGRIVLIDMDTGNVIDYANFDGNVRWPDSGDVTSKYDALHLLYNHYWSYVEGYNENIMSVHEFIMPVAQEEIDAVNAELKMMFVR